MISDPGTLLAHRELHAERIVFLIVSVISLVIEP
jgi:hypothetical protein